MTAAADASIAIDLYWTWLELVGRREFKNDARAALCGVATAKSAFLASLPGEE